MSSPVALVLDDVHTLHNSECRAAVSVLADHVPGGSRLVLAGRAEPPLRIARLRAEGKIPEIGLRDLSLTQKEASLLLATADGRGWHRRTVVRPRRKRPGTWHGAIAWPRRADRHPGAAARYWL
jgi:ATP/maltotriose-dependent transcriptional regulator MalT